ncbi:MULTISPECIES: hypothetical protein [Mycolicibacter]|uniref:Uncharacterized protein n=2 Tax=Mycolicibacter TaxID=1073531 RepID=A0ABU5XL59_9MYCO|nr:MULTISPECIES: hypothetical protein [unclassified Mycolicibacter]MEB3023031.1 hypothetical protein [Mycolicibacter sp. MYC098]MEB3033541.1 hypothetical protein [Mycolicibacter sp. MYC340]
MRAGDLLHYECGMHRGSAPSTAGATLERFEEQLRTHLAGGPCTLHDQAVPQLSGAGETCQACGQATQYHGTT